MRRSSWPLAACLCLALPAAGCTRRTEDKASVFAHYFGEAPPAGANILRANYWATYRVGLDEEELLLEAELPGAFMNARLRAYADAPAPGQTQGWPAYLNVDSDLTDALEEAPTWFQPRDRSRYSVVQPGRDFVVVTFEDDAAPARRFQLWLAMNVRGHVFIERPNGHVFVHYQMP